MNDLFSLFYSLQIACYLSIYSVQIPANAEMFISEFTKLIEFEFLNPEGLVRIFKPDFVLKEWITGNYENVINND